MKRELQNLRTVKQMAAPHGPCSEGALRNQIFAERQNGMYELGVVVRIGRKVLIDADRYLQWIESLQTPRRPSGGSNVTVLSQRAGTA